MDGTWHVIDDVDDANGQVLYRTVHTWMAHGWHMDATWHWPNPKVRNSHELFPIEFSLGYF